MDTASESYEYRAGRHVWRGVGNWQTGRKAYFDWGGIVPIRRGVSVCLCGMAHWHNDDVDYEYSYSM